MTYDQEIKLLQDVATLMERTKGMPRNNVVATSGLVGAVIALITALTSWLLKG